MSQPVGSSAPPSDHPDGGSTRWAWSICACVVLLLPWIAWGLSKTQLRNDTDTWLPRDDPHGQILDWHQTLFPSEDVVLLSWSGSTLNDPRVEEFAARLRGERGTPVFGIDRVTTPLNPLESMAKFDVPQEEGTRRLLGTFIGVGFLKVQLTEAGRVDRDQTDTLLQELGRRLGLRFELHPPVNEPEEWLTFRGKSDDSVLTRPFTPLPPHDLQIRWPEISPEYPGLHQIQEYLTQLEINGERLIAESFFAPGSPVAIHVSVTDDGLEQVEQVLESLQAVAEEVGIPRDSLHLGGSVVTRARLNQESSRALWNSDYPAWWFHKRSPILLSGLVGLLISFLVLRSIWLATLVMFVSVLSACGMLSIVSATGTPLNLVLVVMPNLLLVLTLSGAIHVSNYWCHAVAAGNPCPVRHAIRTAWKPCSLASLTTAIGLMSLLASKLTPVRDFGWYSAWGCLLSLVLVLVVLPACLRLFPPRRAASMVERTGLWEQFGRWIGTVHRWIVATALALLLIGGWGLQWFRTETKAIRYFPEGSQIVRDYRFLEESLAGIISIEVDIRFPRQRSEESEGETSLPVRRQNVIERMRLVHEVEEAIARHHSISGTLSAADFQIIPDPPGPDASSRERMLFGRRAQRTERELFDEGRTEARDLVQRIDSPLTVSLAGREINWHAGDEVWRIRAQSSVMSDLSYAVLLEEIDQQVAETLASREGADVDYVVTGLVPLLLRTQQEVLDSLINSFGLAFVLIAAVMSVLLRNPLAGMVTMFPNFLPVLVVFGLLSLGGVRVDMGTMITASVALGIAVDGTLHLLTWFQASLQDGLDRKAAVARALAHCGPAMWQTSISISLGLLMLWGADLLLISRFGWLMASLILMALVADVIITPALLCGLLGRLLERSVLRRERRPPPDLLLHSKDFPIGLSRPSAVEADAGPLAQSTMLPTMAKGKDRPEKL